MASQIVRVGFRFLESPGSARSVKAECSAPSKTSSYFPPEGNTASRDCMSALPITERSCVPVISIHGDATLPKTFPGSPRRGLLGLKTMAASILDSANGCRPLPMLCPLTAYVVIAPNECPDIPRRSRSRLPLRTCATSRFQRSSRSSAAGTSSTRRKKFSDPRPSALPSCALRAARPSNPRYRCPNAGERLRHTRVRPSDFP